MVAVTYKNKTFQTNGETTLLDTILASGTLMRSSCKDGFCQQCMAKAVKGTPPPESQEGLKPHYVEQNCFLPCRCFPTEDLEIEDATRDNVKPADLGISDFAEYQAMMLSRDWLNDEVIRFCLMRPEPLRYKAGQFINLHHPDLGIRRSYSLASTPTENFIELQIKRISEGVMSNWICDDAQLGTDITISGPFGDFYYQPGNPGQPLILVGISTGLAPLYGIIRDALESDHQGQITLFHANLTKEGIYYQEEIDAIIDEAPNVRYIPCILKGEPPQGVIQGSIDKLVQEIMGDCTNHAAYLCGDGAVIQTIKTSLIEAGINENDIYSDAFTPA